MNSQQTRTPTHHHAVCLAFPPCLALAQPLPKAPSPSICSGPSLVPLQNPWFHTGITDPSHRFPQVLRDRASIGFAKTKYQDRGKVVLSPASGPGLRAMLPATQSESVLYPRRAHRWMPADLEVCREGLQACICMCRGPHSPGHTPWDLGLLRLPLWTPCL